MVKSINEIKNITIIGTGAWGTAIGKVLSESGNNVTMYGIAKKEINDINKNGMNKAYFANRKINTIIRATNDLDVALKEAHYVILAIPSNFLKNALYDIKKKVKTPAIFINLVKGLDPNTKKPWSFTISKIMNKKAIGVASLIGPSFAIDVFHNAPTSVNVVANDPKIAKKVKEIFDVPYFRIAFCDDELGSETIAAFKNLLAIGMGIAWEENKSPNTIASIFAQGVKEISKIAVAKGGKPETILEYCGIGDIYLTCTSSKSRNFTYGKNFYRVSLNTDKKTKIRQAKKLLSDITVEGLTLYKIVNQDIIKRNDLPAFKAICNVLSGYVEPKNLISAFFELLNDKK
ncbi:MAG: NAD(P)H-dependent glycerol-3-phosphate dehydrogenase [Mycoplasmoidaceae bacterium]